MRRISTVTVDFGNGSTVEFDDVQYISTFSDLIKTRLFLKSSPIVFEGEGRALHGMHI